MKRILKYMVRYWYYYFFAVICLLGGLFLDLNNPRVTKRIIDEVVVGGNLEVFKTLILMMAGITFGRAVFGYLRELLFDFSSVNIICQLRQDLFDHIQTLSANFFEEKNTGELMARIKEDADKIWYGISFGLMLSIEVLLSIIFATIFMFQISPKLSLLAFITLPLIGYIALRLEKSIGNTFGQISEQNAKLNTIAQENISGVRLVKAFARERYEISKFLKHNKEYYDLNIHQARVWSKFHPKLEFFTSILPIIVIAFGGAFVIKEEMTIGTLIQFSGYMYMIVWPMRMIGWLSNTMAEAGASSKKIDKIFAQHSEINNKEGAVVLDQLLGKVEFKDVSFKVGETEVIKNINFSIEQGKTLAIMGETGSGKSTIMNLLIRFYDKTSGQININGVEINDMDMKTLRKNISVVMQDTFLFSDTIEENIKFGSKEFVTTSHMLDSSKNAESHEFVARMEDEYQTVIGEKGIGLSGGQKQRISIARALAKNSNIIVFDDSTSALDMETEYRIQKKIEELENVTKIIIAHRISAVKKADEIIILEKGTIVERGTHKELLKQKGRYYETFMEQYEGVGDTLHLA